VIILPDIILGLLSDFVLDLFVDAFLGLSWTPFRPLLEAPSKVTHFLLSA
jgi:hypothetical protein